MRSMHLIVKTNGPGEDARAIVFFGGRSRCGVILDGGLGFLSEE
jgi:hypothetical protein